MANKRKDTHAWLDANETMVFDMYIEAGNFKKWVARIREYTNTLDWEVFYAWLKATDQRWERWQTCQNIRGHISASEAEEVAEAATQQDANASRLKYEAKMRAAEHQNRQQFGKRQQVELAVTVSDEWAQALMAASEPDLLESGEEIEEAEWEENDD